MYVPNDRSLGTDMHDRSNEPATEDLLVSKRSPHQARLPPILKAGLCVLKYGADPAKKSSVVNFRQLSVGYYEKNISSNRLTVGG